MSKTPKLKDLLENAGDPMGDPSFRGGPYGFGGVRQLYVINPATQAIANQENEDNPLDIARLSWVMKKYRRLPPLEPLDLNPRIPAPAAIKEEDEKTLEEELLLEREPSDGLYRDLQGYPPQPNALVMQVDHVPDPDGKINLDPLSGQPLEFLGPTLDFAPIDSIETQNWDDLTPEEVEVVIKTQKDMGIEKELQEILTPGSGPMVRGASNFQVNSLARPALYVSPEEKAYLDEPISPLGGMGAIGWPRKYVPDDWEVRMRQIDQYSMATQDIMGSRRLQLHQNPTMMPEENTYNEEKEVLDEELMEKENILETPKLSPAEKKLKGPQRRKSTTALREMIDAIVAEIVLPSPAETGLGGAKAFEESQEKVQAALHKPDPGDPGILDDVKIVQLEEALEEAKFCINSKEERKEKFKKHVRPTKPKTWARAKKMAKQEFDLKTNKRMMNWPSVRAVARAEEIYRSMGGKWRKQKKRDPFAKDAAGNLAESISLDEVVNIELLLEKNVPTNKALWSRAKAAARAKFDVYPCVPLSSKALTKDGWKTYNELSVGDVICTYNISENCLEWKTIQHLHFYKDAETINIYTPQTNFNFVCTPNHKWVLKKTWADISEDKRGYRYWKEDHLVEAKDINKKMKIITSAKLKDNNSDPILLENFSKYGESWVQKITRMSNEQREAFFAAAIVYDGHEKLSEDTTDERAIRYGFSQKNSDHGEAVEICAALLGYRVSFRNKKDNSTMTDWTFSRRNTQGTNNVFTKPDIIQDVWCPQTENSTWLMKQDGMITITGNSAYANAWAAKWYKKKGGGWRKTKGKK